MCFLNFVCVNKTDMNYSTVFILILVLMAVSAAGGAYLYKMYGVSDADCKKMVQNAVNKAVTNAKKEQKKADEEEARKREEEQKKNNGGEQSLGWF
jgi:ABC-type transporter MlaC component